MSNSNLKLNKSKITAMIVSVVCLVCIVVAVIFGFKLPKVNREYFSDGENYTSQTKFSEDEILYSSNERLFLSKQGKGVERTIDVKTEALDKFGEDIGRVGAVYKEKDRNSVFVAAKNYETNLSYLIALDDTFSAVSIAEYSGDYRMMKCFGGYVYVITESSGYFNIYRYPEDDISAETVRGHLYSGFDDGNTVTLTVVKGEKILSVVGMEDRLYVLTTNGFIVTDTELSGCAYMAEYEDKYAELKATYPEEDDTELIAQAVQFVKDIHGGNVFLNVGRGTVEIPSNLFDTEQYLYVTGENSYTGGVLLPENGFYYLVSSDAGFYKAKAEDIFSTDFGESLETQKIDTVNLLGLPYYDNNALSFDAYENSAYIVYVTLADITKIDLINETIAYSVSADFKIESVVCADGVLSYLYQNSNIAPSGTMIKATFTADEKIHADTYKTIFIIFVVVSIVLCAASAIAIVCAANLRFKEKTIDLLKRVKKARFVYLAMLPSFILLCAFCFYPAIASIGLSFFDYTQAKPMLLWNNFKHYINIFTSEASVTAFSNMGLFLLVDLVVALIPPLLFAFFLTVMANKKYSAITRTLLFIPGIIPSVTSLLIWQTGIYGYSGVLNMIIKACGGTPVLLLESSSTAKWAILSMGFPYVGSYLIFYGAMMNIPDSYYEAAELEGCGVLRRFFQIDIPLILSQIKYVFVCTFIVSLQNFARTYMVDKSASYGTLTPIHKMYSLMLTGDYGYSAAYATVIFLFLLVATIINMKMQFKNSEEEG